MASAVSWQGMACARLVASGMVRLLWCRCMTRRWRLMACAGAGVGGAIEGAGGHGGRGAAVCLRRCGCVLRRVASSRLRSVMGGLGSMQGSRMAAGGSMALGVMWVLLIGPLMWV